MPVPISYVATPSRKPPEEPDGHPSRPMDLSQASGYPPNAAIGGNDGRGRPPWAWGTLVMHRAGESLFPAEPAPAPGLLVVPPTPPRASGLFPTGGGLEAWRHVILTAGLGSGRIEGRPYPWLDGPHGPTGGGPNLGWALASSSDTPMLFPAEEPEQEDQPPKSQRHAAFTPARGAAKRWKKQKDTLAAAGAAGAAEAEAKGEEQEEGGTSVKRNKATERLTMRLQCKKLDNGKVRWQGWYPGAVPASYSVTRPCGQDAYNEVMKWICNQHEKKNPSS